MERELQLDPKLFNLDLNFKTESFMEETSLKTAIEYQGLRKPKIITKTISEKELICTCLELFELNSTLWRDFELRILTLDCLLDSAQSLIPNDILILKLKNSCESQPKKWK